MWLSIHSICILVFRHTRVVYQLTYHFPGASYFLYKYDLVGDVRDVSPRNGLVQGKIKKGFTSQQCGRKKLTSIWRGISQSGRIWPVQLIDCDIFLKISGKIESSPFRNSREENPVLDRSQDVTTALPLMLDRMSPPNHLPVVRRYGWISMVSFQPGTGSCRTFSDSGSIRQPSGLPSTPWCWKIYQHLPGQNQPVMSLNIYHTNIIYIISIHIHTWAGHGRSIFQLSMLRGSRSWFATNCSLASRSYPPPRTPSCTAPGERRGERRATEPGGRAFRRRRVNKGVWSYKDDMIRGAAPKRVSDDLFEIWCLDTSVFFGIVIKWWVLVYEVRITYRYIPIINPLVKV